MDGLPEKDADISDSDTHSVVVAIPKRFVFTFVPRPLPQFFPISVNFKNVK